MSDRVADVIDSAADVIEKFGWCQRASVAPDGRHCMVGALQEILRVNDPNLCSLGVMQQHEVLYSAATTALSNTLAEREGAINIVAWNDARGRTKDEVLDLMRAAAKQQRM